MINDQTTPYDPPQPEADKITCVSPELINFQSAANKYLVGVQKRNSQSNIPVKGATHDERRTQKHLFEDVTFSQKFN